MSYKELDKEIAASRDSIKSVEAKKAKMVKEHLHHALYEMAKADCFSEKWPDTKRAAELMNNPSHDFIIALNIARNLLSYFHNWGTIEEAYDTLDHFINERFEKRQK